jgi:hypothetical protein
MEGAALKGATPPFVLPGLSYIDCRAVWCRDVHPRSGDEWASPLLSN